jgi:hypothetical protein
MTLDQSETADAGKGRRPAALPLFLRVPLAPIIASLAAGPLTLLLMLVPTLVTGPSRILEPVSELLAAIGIFTAYGAVFSILPNLLGTAVMFLLSRHFLFACRRFVWTAAGGAGGAVFGYLWEPGGTDSFLTLVLIVTGACCATICHLIARPD